MKHVEKMDGVIALAFVLLYALLMMMPLHRIPRTAMYIYGQLIVQSGWLMIILLMLRLRKQKIHTIGLSRSLTPYIAFVAFSAAAAIDALRQANMTILGRWFFYAIAVGGLEEILFRGYLHPRLAKLLNSPKWAVLLGGLLFGAMHHIAPMVWNQAPWYGVFSELGGGVLGHFFFLLVYVNTGNIMDAILLHAAMDNGKYRPWMLAPCILYIVARIAITHIRCKKGNSGPEWVP